MATMFAMVSIVWASSNNDTTNDESKQNGAEIKDGTLEQRQESDSKPVKILEVPELVFDSADSSTCRENMTKIHERVQDVYYRKRVTNQARLDTSYQGILDFGVSLVDNDKFLDWTTDDWKKSYRQTKNGNRPDLNKEMSRTFTTKFDKSQEITTLADMEKAMAVLFRFRARIGLEHEIMFKLASIPKSEYAMCSEGTQKLGD